MSVLQIDKRGLRPTARFTLDLTFNCFTKDHLGTLFDWLEKYPGLVLNLATNYISFEDILEKARELSRTK